MVGRVLHIFMEESVQSNMPVCCYFEPVAEGAIEVTPYSCKMTAMGQMFTLISAHCGGKICPLTGAETAEIMATHREDVVTVTLLNTDAEHTRTYTLALTGELLEARSLVAGSILPHSLFFEESAEVSAEETGMSVVIPPCSAVRLRVRGNYN